jgi:hypothetical protein
VEEIAVLLLRAEHRNHANTQETRMKQTSYAQSMPAEALNPGEARAHGEKVAMLGVLPIIAAT